MTASNSGQPKPSGAAGQRPPTPSLTPEQLFPMSVNPSESGVPAAGFTQPDRISGSGQTLAYTGPVDLLEIYHARSIRDAILAQLRRLYLPGEVLSLDERRRRRQIRNYYEAQLLTVVELLQELGDHDVL